MTYDVNEEDVDIILFLVETLSVAAW